MTSELVPAVPGGSSDEHPDRPAPADALAALRTSHDRLPRRVRDVVYGKLTERVDIVAMLDAMSRASAAKLSADPAFVAGAGGPIDRDPLLDHVAGLIAGGAHIPEGDRVVVPASPAPTLVGLTAVERGHFGRED